VPRVARRPAAVADRRHSGMSPNGDFPVCRRSLTCYTRPVIRNAADVGAIIRDRRRKLGLDQSALARRVGVSRQWIVDIEKGKPRAGIELVLRTLAALGVSLAPADRPGPRQRAAAAAVDLDAIIDAARRPKR